MPHQEKQSDYLEILKRRKWLLIIPSVLGLIIAAVVASTLPAYYRSTTMILIEEQQVSESYVQPTDLTPVSSRLNTLSQQIMSRTRLEAIANEFKLFDDANKQSLVSKVLKRLGLGGEGKGVSKEAVIQSLRRDIDVQVLNERKTRTDSGGEAFRISYVGKDPYKTMNITSTIASLYIEENLKVREMYAEGTSDFLQGELNKAKLELEQQEITLRRFKERHMGSLPEQLDANLRTLDRLQFELQSVHDGLQNSNQRKGMLERQLDQATALDSPAPGNTLELQLREREAELQSLLSVYNEIYPDVIIAKNRVADIKAKIAEKKNGILDEPGDVATAEEQTGAELAAKELAAQEQASEVVGADKFNVMSELSVVKSKIRNYQKKERDVQAQIKRYERRVEETPANEQKIIDIRRDYEISLQNYRSLLEKKLNARLAANLEKKQKGARFRVIDPANLPERPYKPDKQKVVALGFAGGFGMGIGLIFLLEFLNPAFRKPEDFIGIIDVPVLAMIPNFQSNSTAVQAKKLRIIKGRKEISRDDGTKKLNGK